MDNKRGIIAPNPQEPGLDATASVSYGRVIPTYAGLSSGPQNPNPAPIVTPVAPVTPIQAVPLTQPQQPTQPTPIATPRPPLQTQPPAKPPVKVSVPWKKFGKTAGFVLLGLLVISGVLVTALSIANRKNSDGSVASQFTTIEIPLDDLIGDSPTTLFGTRSLIVNGSLQANNSIIISPSRQPSNANRGQIYYDETTDQLAYYNGAQFVQVGNNTAPVTTVQSVGGQSGQVALGAGLTAANGALNNSGVLSLQGQTGNILLTAGPGIAVDGTTLINTGITSFGGQTGDIAVGGGLTLTNGTLQNSGIVSAASGSANITVVNDGNGNITISSAGGGTGTVQSPGGTAGRIAKFTGVQTVADSLLSEGGSTVTVNGSLSVTGGLALVNALTVGNGGTGTTSLTNNGVVVGQGMGALSAITAASPGLCFISTAGAPQFSACPGAVGVASVNGQTGTVTLANASGAGSTITINDAGTSQKGIASFNSTNFTANSGAINTVQNIHVAATPTFGALSLTSSQATSPMLLVNNTNTAATGNLVDLQLNGSSRFSVSPAGTMIISGTLNGQTISSAANFSGTLTVASTATFSGNTSVGGTLTANTITPSSAMAVGATNQTLALQGNTATTLSATNGVNSTTLAFQAPTANVTYRLLATAAGTYDICTSAGNCTGIGGSVTTSGGTAGRIAKFTASQGIGDSIITDNGSTVTIGGTLAANTITPTAALIIGATNQTLTLQGSTTAITATNGGSTNTLTFATPSGAGKTITLPNATGTIAVSASGPLAIDANGNITCTTCVTSGGGGGGIAGVDSVNGLTGALTVANSSGAGTTITIDNASTSQKGIAQFNSTNFTASAGTINTIQSIATNAAPTFARLTLTSSEASNAMLVVNNTDTGATANLLDLQTNGVTQLSVSPAGALTLGGTINGQTISSAASLTGTLAVAGIASLGGGAIVSGTLAANTITPSAAMTVGSTSQSITVQGSAGSTIVASNSGNTTTIAFQAPTASVTYRFAATAAGTYDICTTTGNCAGVGGTITGAGTAGALAKFTSSGAIGNSILSESGSTITANGNINITTGNQFQINGAQISSAVLSNDANLAKLNASQTFTGDNSLTGSTTLGDSTADTLTVGAILQGATPLTFEGGTADDNELALAINTLTADRTVTFGDENGTVCLQGSTNCGFAAATGSNSYIQNQTAAAQLANFYIQSAAAATSPTAALRLASGQTGNLLEFQDTSGNIAARVDSSGFMHIDRAAATSDIAFTVKAAADTHSRLTISADGKIGWGSGSAPTDNFLTRTVAGALEASNQFTVLGGLQVGAPGFIGKLTIQGGSTSTVSQVIRAVASQTADQIQLQDSAGNVNASFNAAGNQLTLGRIAASGTVTQGKLLLSDGTTDNYGLTIQTTTLTASRTITLPNETGIVCLQGSTACGFATSGSASYIQNSTTQQTANMNIISAAAGSVGARIEGAPNMSAQALVVRSGSSPTANAFEVQNSSGIQLFGIDASNSRVTVGSGSSCTGRLCVGQSVTGSGTTTNLYNIQTINTSGAGTVVGHNVIMTDTSVAQANTLRPFIIDTTGTTNTSASINAIQVKLPAGAAGTALQIQNGSTDIVNIANNGASTFQNTTNSSGAFRILNQNGNSLLNVDSTNGGNASILGLTSGEVGTWQTTSESLPAARYGGTTVTANGYVYYIGGYNSAGTPQTTVYYGRLNSDGSVSGWATNGNSLPVALTRHSSVTINGYIYVMGGQDTGGNTLQTVYSAKLYPNGTTSSWSSTSSLPQIRRNGSAVVTNGYIYFMGGQDNLGAPQTNAFYTKANPDGSLNTWSTAANTVPQARYFAASAAANGYVYFMGGTNASGVIQSTVYYTKPSATDGSPGIWSTAANALPGARAESTALVMNGYVYMIGGADAANYLTTVNYARLNADGSVGAWATAANALPATRASAAGLVANGYAYVIGGYNGSAISTIRHTSMARLQIGGSIDLVGLQGQNLIDTGNPGTGSTGGSITAGNGTFVGTLQTQGLATFNQGATVNGGLSVLGGATVAGDLKLTSKLADAQGFEDTTFVPTSPGTWSTGGNASWSRSTAQSEEGAASAASGTITNNQSSWLDMDYTFTQDGILQFSWKVSSEDGWDNLVVCVDNDACTFESGYTYAITGETDWADIGIPVSAGTHSFRWVYGKDSSSSAGSDKGWVDNVRFTGGTGKVSGSYLTFESYGMHVDTHGGNFTIGNLDSIGALLVLDAKDSSGDPGGVEGGMYYNAFSDRFRCYEDFYWKDCIFTPSRTSYASTSAQSIPSATDTKITFGGINEGNSDIDVTGNNTFTINRPGVWLINTSLRFGGGTGGTGERYVTIAACVDAGQQPNPRYGQSTSHAGGSYSVAVSTTATARFTAGSNVCIYGYQNSSGAVNTDISWGGTNVSFTWLGE